MNQYVVIMTEPAANDLRKIAHYVSSELKEPAAARKLVADIKDAVLSLREMPTRYELVLDPRLSAQGIRKLLVKNYIVIYIVSEGKQNVIVIRILCGRRNWEDLL